MTDATIDEGDIFSTPIFNTTYSKHEHEQSEIIDVLDSYKEKTVNQNRKHHKTFISPCDLHHNPNFDNLVEEISTIIPKLKERWYLEDPTKIGIKHMSGSITSPGGLLMPHKETFVFMNGIYFLNTPPLSGFLSIESPVVDVSFYSNLSIIENNSINSPEVSLLMPQGNVMFFPGYLRHQITLNEAELNRYLIHFSLVIVE